MIKLREARREKGLRQADLAQIVHVSIQTISGYETGYAQPPIDILVKIANALEVSTDYLLGRENDVGLVEIKTELTTDEQELVNLYRKMSFGDKNQLLGFAKGLVY